jgi:rare lipoprotein A
MRRFLFMVCPLIALLGCVTGPTRNFYPPDFVLVPNTTQRGIASWYGPQFHGRPTSSGERYNQNDYTAAHRTLPFGTIVRVKNLHSQRSVLVEITDRGPFIAGRIIDLSRRAAEEVDLIGPGTAEVEVQIVRHR